VFDVVVDVVELGFEVVEVAVVVTVVAVVVLEVVIVVVVVLVEVGVEVEIVVVAAVVVVGVDGVVDFIDNLVFVFRDMITLGLVGLDDVVLLDLFMAGLVDSVVVVCMILDLFRPDLVDLAASCL
jgi:hypothetical protein